MCFMSTTIPHFKHCFLKTNPHIVNEKANGIAHYLLQFENIEDPMK